MVYSAKKLAARAEAVLDALAPECDNDQSPQRIGFLKEHWRGTWNAWKPGHHAWIPMTMNDQRLPRFCYFCYVDEQPEQS